MAALLCRQCGILVMDEPTNYMDIYLLEALENMLVEYKGTLIFTSHDRRFRENIAERILKLENGRLYEEVPKPAEPESDIEAKLMLLQMKADRLIECMRDAGEAQQAEAEQEYQKILEEMNRLKATQT